MWEALAEVLNAVLPWPRRHVVPDVSGLTQEEAHERLLRREYVLGRADGEGVVVRQTPAPGTRRKAWSPVHVELG